MEDGDEMPVKEGLSRDIEAEPEIADRGLRWLTRHQVAKMLGISIASVRRMEQQGTLHPRMSQGVNFFDSREVRALARDRASLSPSPLVRARAAASFPLCSVPGRTEGQEAADVFRLLNENKGLRDIVIEARIAPIRVRALYREWCLSLEEGERLLDSIEQLTSQGNMRQSPRTRSGRRFAQLPDPEPASLAGESGDDAVAELNRLASAAERLFEKKD